MRRCILLFLLCLLLAGCAAPELPPPETVCDTLLPEKAALPNPYTITIAVPPDAQKNELTPGGSQTVYRQKDGAYEIITRLILANDRKSAIRQLTGFEAHQLQVVETTRFHLPEYRFVWYVPGDPEGTLCRGAMLRDGQRYYTVVFAAPESAGTRYNAVATEVFASIGLDYDEGA